MFRSVWSFVAIWFVCFRATSPHSFKLFEDLVCLRSRLPWSAFFTAKILSSSLNQTFGRLPCPGFFAVRLLIFRLDQSSWSITSFRFRRRQVSLLQAWSIFMVGNLVQVSTPSSFSSSLYDRSGWPSSGFFAGRLLRLQTWLDFSPSDLIRLDQILWPVNLFRFLLLLVSSSIVSFLSGPQPWLSFLILWLR